MSRPYFRLDKDDKKKPKGNTPWTFIIGIASLIFCSIIFYIAVNNYLIDQKDRTLVSGQQNRIRAINDQNALNSKTQTSLTNIEQQLDVLNAGCNSVRQRISEDQMDLSDNTQPAFNLYQMINNRLIQENATCVSEVDRLTVLLDNLISASNNTAIVVKSGTCQLNSPLLVNVTMDLVTVPFEYKRVIVSGLDFYYYVFGNATDYIEASTGVLLNNCSPILFRGAQSVFTTTDLNGITTQPVPVSDYLAYLRLGMEQIEFVPNVVPTVNQTLTLNGQGLKIWVNLF